MNEEEIRKMAENVRHLKLLAHVVIWTTAGCILILHIFGDYLPK